MPIPFFSRAESASVLPLTAPPIPDNQSSKSSSDRDEPSTNQADRNLTIQIPTTQPPTLAPPITAPANLANNTPTSPRNRAHSVSVSLPRPKVQRKPSALINTTTTARQPSGDSQPPISRSSGDDNAKSQMPSKGRLRRATLLGRSRDESISSPANFELPEQGRGDEQLGDEVVGMLDCVDTQVATVNHLQNMSNTLIFPHLPALWSRRPEVVLPKGDSEENLLPRNPESAAEEGNAPYQTPGPGPQTSSTRSRAASTTRPRSSTVSGLFPPPTATTAITTTSPTTSQLTGSQPIPLPSTATTASTLTAEPQTLEEITQTGDHELDAHVRRLLRRKTRVEYIKRTAAGLWSFVKTPMGFVTAVYGFLVVFWGAAIVLFLLGWIPTNSKNTQDIWVEISSQVVNGLFTVTGVGLIPWRSLDTYRMAKIWHLRVETVKRRRKQNLPPVEDANDLPDPQQVKDYVSVLSEKEQEELHYQQEMFAKSQTWYKPHATDTHRAFPIKWALWNTILMDGNSFFQCLLCGCMWGMNRHKRPAWTTGTLIPCSFLCGIGAAILIWQGSKRTKKTAEVEDKLRIALDMNGSSNTIASAPETKDGTIIASTEKKAASEEVPLRVLGDEEKGGEGRKRRTTVTFGESRRASLGVVEEDGEGGRRRGRTLGEPEMIGKVEEGDERGL